MSRPPFRRCMAPFEEYKSRGPRMDGSKGRSVLSLAGMSGQPPRIIPYARYLLSVHLGRTLLPSEHVDHVDEDRTHDMVPNLQVLSPEENSRKAHRHNFLGQYTRRKTVLRFECLHCGKEFLRNRAQSHLGRGGHATYCSRACSAFAVSYAGIPQKYGPVPQSQMDAMRSSRLQQPRNVQEDWMAWSTELPYEYRPLGGQGRLHRCRRCGKSFRAERRKERVASGAVYCSLGCSGKDRGSRIPSESVVRSLVRDIREGRSNWTATGARYGVSDNAIRKWAKHYGLL